MRSKEFPSTKRKDTSKPSKGGSPHEKVRFIFFLYSLELVIFQKLTNAKGVTVVPTITYKGFFLHRILFLTTQK